VLLQKRRNGKSKEFSEQCNQVEPSISWGRRGEKDIRKFVRNEMVGRNCRSSFILGEATW